MAGARQAVFKNGQDANVAGTIDPLADPEERRIIFAVLDSFRCVI